MKKRENEPSFKCLSYRYTLDGLKVHYAGNDSYLIRAVISGRWTLSANITQKEYHQYRDTFYTDPAEAKNYLLDLLPWYGYPFTRDTFCFVENGEPISEDSLNELRRFVSTLE